MQKAVIISAVRTPIGDFGGSLSNIPAQDIGAIVMEECIKRAGIDSNIIDEVIVGNIIQTDPRGNPGREAALKAKIPIKVPAYTVNKNCGSSIKALALGELLIRAKDAEVVLVAGMENMTLAPYVLRKARFGYRMGDDLVTDLLTDLLEGMGMTAERLAEKYNITREEQDEFAFNSQMKANKAQSEGRFHGEIVPIQIKERKKEYIFSKDEGIKSNTTMEGLSKLRAVFKKDGTVTAGNSSTINDAAAAILLMSEEKAKTLGIKPLAEVVCFASAGVEPEIMGIGPVESTKLALEKSGLTLEDIDFIELNEAFAAQSIAVIRELNLDPKKVNIDGGAIALGHPVGATGAIIVTKLINQLKRNDKTYGLATMCIGDRKSVV